MAFVKGGLTVHVQQLLQRALGVKTPTLELPFEVQALFDAGVSAGQCNRALFGQATIVNNATPTVLDLSSAAALDPMGDPATMAKVCLVLLVNRDAANGVTVGGGATPFAAWMGAGTETRKLAAAGGIELATNFTAAAWACGAGAQNLRLVADAGTSVKVDYLILGRSS